MNVTVGTQVSRHYWWIMGLRGLIAVLFGLIAVVRPFSTLLVLVLFFGAYALVNGVIVAIIAFQERKAFARWWVLLLEGLVGIIAGVLTFLSPYFAALVLLYVIAAWAIVTGVLELATAFSGWLPVALEWSLGLAGILSVLLGVFLILQPVAGLFGLVWLIGVYALAYGILLIIRAFQFRRVATT
jgi:uncharacterized membrane protein HdeD (DUF308 family)